MQRPHKVRWYDGVEQMVGGIKTREACYAERPPSKITGGK